MDVEVSGQNVLPFTLPTASEQ